MRVAVLISGGVDSAVAVHRLLEQGHDLHLFYIRIGLDTGEGDCSAEEDIEMCRYIAAKYSLPFDVVSLHEEYWENVMDYALRSVREGLTPNPDVMCNKMIKFGFFEERWGKEFDRTATGHYATTREIDGLTWLGTGVDRVKDQTDFLCRISYSQLSHLMFPIGELPKAEVRRIAIETRMPNAVTARGYASSAKSITTTSSDATSAKSPDPSSNLRPDASSAPTADSGSTPSDSAKGSGLAADHGMWSRRTPTTTSYTSPKATTPKSSMAQPSISTRCTGSRATPGVLTATR